MSGAESASPVVGVWDPDAEVAPTWLEAWMVDTIHGAFTPPATLQRVGAGQSNVTYRMTDAAGHTWIVRRPPGGIRQGKAHDVLREARILTALARSSIPVPTVVGSCDALGERPAFYVMEDLDGVVVESDAEADELTPDERAAVSKAAIETLAALHELDVDAVGLGTLGAREGYVGRQMKRLSANWQMWGLESDTNSSWQALAGLLAEVDWATDRVSIVHGDFRISNLMLSGSEVRAVLDWELTALGDPLADLAWMLDDWRGPTEPRIAFPTPTSVGGFLTRAELVDLYVSRTGFNVERLDSFRALTHWKAATLAQGVLVRRRAGTLGAHGAMDLPQLESTIRLLVDEGLELMHS